MPLKFADIGMEYEIKKVKGSETVITHLKNLGFVIGNKVKIISSNGGNLIVDILGSRVALSDELALKIII